MIDKKLVKNSFKKSLETYEANAFVQKDMASKLIELLPSKTFDRVLEIGMGTGVLTKLLFEKLDIKEFFANDIVAECDEYLSEIAPESIFIEGDIEELILPDKFSLVASNASFQWIVDFPFFIKKISSVIEKNGYLLFSTFGQENFKELSNITDISLEYMNAEELKKVLSEKFEIAAIKESKEKVYFKNFRELIRHLKTTGVNGVPHKPITYVAMKKFEKEYKKSYKDKNGLFLTYNPIYVLCKRK